MHQIASVLAVLVANDRTWGMLAFPQWETWGWSQNGTITTITSCYSVIFHSLGWIFVTTIFMHFIFQPPTTINHHTIPIPRESPRRSGVGPVSPLKWMTGQPDGTLTDPRRGPSGKNSLTVGPEVKTKENPTKPGGGEAKLFMILVPKLQKKTSSPKVSGT